MLPQPQLEPSRRGWIAFGMSMVPIVVLLLRLVGVNAALLGILAVLALASALFLAATALRRGARPRWPAVAALCVVGIWLVVLVGFLIWAVVGLVQIMFLPTY